MKKNRRGRAPHAGWRSAKQKPERSTSIASETVPLARVNAIVRELGPLLTGAAENLRAIEDRHHAVLSASATAWAERENLLHRYYGFVRSILQVRDDCTRCDADSPGMGAVRAGLDRALAEQRIEELPVKAGDAFDPEIHECESAAGIGEDSRGAVVANVIQPGFVQRVQGGLGVVVRPAKVQINHDMNEGDDNR